MDQEDLVQPLIRADDGRLYNPELALAINAWKVPIVDDDSLEREIAEIALKGLRFQERPLQFQHACSPPEAERLPSDEDIHLYGRIAAVADLIDSLLSSGCYKTAWELSEVVNYFPPTAQPALQPQTDRPAARKPWTSSWPPATATARPAK